MANVSTFVDSLAAALEADRPRCTVTIDRPGAALLCTEPGARVRLTCSRGHVDNKAHLCLQHIGSSLVCACRDNGIDCTAPIVSVVAEVA